MRGKTWHVLSEIAVFISYFQKGDTKCLWLTFKKSYSNSSNSFLNLFWDLLLNHSYKWPHFSRVLWWRLSYGGVWTGEEAQRQDQNTLNDSRQLITISLREAERSRWCVRMCIIHSIWLSTGACVLGNWGLTLGDANPWPHSRPAFSITDSFRMHAQPSWALTVTSSDVS